MRLRADFHIEQFTEFKEKLNIWAAKQNFIAILDSNSQTNRPQGLLENNSEVLLAWNSIDEFKQDYKGAFNALKEYYDLHKDWLFGYLSYDLKNDIEEISSHNFDGLNFPDIYFFRPQLVFDLKKDKLSVWYLEKYDSVASIKDLLLEIQSIQATENETLQNPYELKARTGFSSYSKNFEQIKRHLKRGDIYEMNYCIEFNAQPRDFNPEAIYKQLKNIAPVPFSVYFTNGTHYLISASPERFLLRKGKRLYSQPIKGTSARESNPIKDRASKNQLLKSEKEQAENIMIVDLVRNDLSRSAKIGSVRVDELCGIYSFPWVHQMISTVSCELQNEVHFIDAIKNAFPMGSMTGAPKIRAMQIIEELEDFKRGLFSGAFGYIRPDGDFDFNVIIRSILYNKEKNYLSFAVGGAITFASELEKEYEECLLKARALVNALNSEIK